MTTRLQDAIRTLSAPATVDVISDERRAVIALRNSPERLRPAPIPELAGPLEVRPIDMLLRLSRATAPDIDEDLFLASRHWSWLKYLGAFETIAGPGSPLVLSQAAANVSHNQRRVMSEEIGIALGITVAEYWCTAVDSHSVTSVVDLDIVLRSSHAWPPVSSTGPRRPDYLVSLTGPHLGGPVEYRTLETKGTRTMSNALTHQIPRAMSQLNSIEVARSGVPRGIAVASVLDGGNVRCLAFSNDMGTFGGLMGDFELEHAKRPLYVGYDEVGRVTTDGPELAEAAAAVEVGKLASFAGLDDVAEHWLPEKPQGSQSKYKEKRRTARDGKREIVEGQVVVGVDDVITIPGTDERLRIFRGVTLEVAHAMGGSSLAGVKEAQSHTRSTVLKGKEARESGRWYDSGASDGGSTVAAVASDGAVLRIERF